MKEKNRKRARSGVWSLLERMLQGVWRYRLLCLLLIIAAMVTTSALMHPGKMQSATALIALNYEEATRGLYPNQTRFNISLLKSDEVLSRALEKAGVTNMEPLALAEHISVSASSVGGMSIDSGSASAYKIATTYTVSYKRNEELPASISTGDMLQLIIEAYKEVFYENYTYVDTALNPNWNELDELEYVEIGTFFEKEIGKVSRFLKSRANENGTFRSSANNETFISLQKKAQNFSKDPPHNCAQPRHIIPADPNFEKKRNSSALFAREINLVTQPSFDCEQGINSQVQTACSNADAIFPVLGIVFCKNERFSLLRKTHVPLWNEPRISHVRLP